MTVGRKSVWCWCTRLVNAFGGLGRASDPGFFPQRICAVEALQRKKRGRLDSDTDPPR